MSITLLLGGVSFAQTQKVQWTSFDQLVSDMQSEARPVMIQVGTSWCSYCKMMDQKVYQDAETASYINRHFYAIRLDAESREEIRFLGKEYKFIPSGPNTGRHRLAETLATQNGTVQYPTVVVLNRQLQPVFRHVGYLAPEELVKILREVNLLSSK